MSGVEAIASDALAAVPHGFLGRRGGLSTGIHAGLNVGVGSDDDPAAVAENRRRAAAAVLPGATLVTVRQVHSADTVTVAAPIALDDRPQADALATATPGLLLGILTADCVPVLLADVEANVVGAAHAGWKGALHGVTDSVVAAMEALGARRGSIAAAIGPCIAGASYEVSAGFADPFLAGDAASARFFAAGRPGHLQFDIAGYVAARLADAGVGTVAMLGLDTYAAPDRFFSYRRACHRGEPGYGRQIALIGVAPRG